LGIRCLPSVIADVYF